MPTSYLESWAFWTGILTVGFTALAALSGCFARWFSSKVSALKSEPPIHTATIASLDWFANWTGSAAVGFTAGAALAGCLYWWFSLSLSEMKENARVRFEQEYDLKMQAAKKETTVALAEAAIARKDTANLELEAAHLREQLTNAQARIKGAEARVAEANERSALASEGTAHALDEAAKARKDTANLEIEAARLREQAALAEFNSKAAEARASEANERSALASEGAARAEKELIEVQSRIKARYFTVSQRTRLLETLKPIPKGPMRITTNLGDGEAITFAYQLQKILHEAGWRDVHVTMGIYSGSVRGLKMNVRDTHNPPPVVSRLAEAFEAIGVDVKGNIDPDLPEDAVGILIGWKPN